MVSSDFQSDDDRNDHRPLYPEELLLVLRLVLGHSWCMHVANLPNSSTSETSVNNETKQNKKKRGGGNNKMTIEQTFAFKSVSKWVFLDHPPSFDSLSSEDDGFGLQNSTIVGTDREKKKLVFELHSHSKFSDAFLSPSKLFERAHGNGVTFFFVFLLVLFALLHFKFWNITNKL